MNRSPLVVFGALVVISAMGLSGCGSKKEAVSEKVAQTGSYIEVEYTLNANGELVVGREKPEVMSLKIGDGIYPLAFEQALAGLKVGDQKEIALAPAQAFGPVKTELMRRVARAQFPPEADLKVGMFIGGQMDGSGEHVALRIAQITDEFVILDQNHPLAGKNVVYKVRVLQVG